MAAMMPVPETNSHCTDSPNYRDKYKTLKRKLKFLLYEQEYFQEELRRVQKKLLRVSRDKRCNLHVVTADFIAFNIRNGNLYLMLDLSMLLVLIAVLVLTQG
ncbi:uncharacterized protein LOC110052156 [Orbicella faveolata]|uniref:uncharacterized protein LOC110052156 n=1 Tax=Orbicella faveolata TaxID=48498 RepID=UPI0009E1DA03|nr:uncharacterized protein LOC110052156 [Orbicella faveolata]